MFEFNAHTQPLNEGRKNEIIFTRIKGTVSSAMPPRQHINICSYTTNTFCKLNF